MSKELILTIEQVSREKGINPEEVVHAIEDAILTATRKNFKNREDLVAKFNRESGQVDIFGSKKAVESVSNPDFEIALPDAQTVREDVQLGESLQVLLSSRPLGRIEAQTAKQIIFQRVKEAERKKVHDEYAERLGDLVNGIVKNFEKGDMIVDLGTIEAILPKSMQSPVETYSRGDRIRAVISKVHRYSNDPQVVLSRIDGRLLTKLFETEVPEVYEGTIEIKAAVREPGDRAKIAVSTKDSEVDPVGACVGIKGTRVQSVINELHGERIDIIEWSDDIVKLASNALKPARVSRVTLLDERDKRLEIIVENDQLSLAIGKKGQNVRLASKLTGWKIDIKSQDEKKKADAEQLARFQAFRERIHSDPDLGEKAMEALQHAGIDSVAKLRSIHSASDLAQMDADMAGRLYDQIQQFVNSPVSG